MQRAASAGRLKAASKPPQSPPERGSVAAPPSQRRPLLAPAQARLLLLFAAVLAFLVWLSASAGMLRTSVPQSHSRGSGTSAATCPAREQRVASGRGPAYGAAL